ncbi:mismatch-specific DNA-glycosylase [Helcobacillus massiliensis]|uniref:TDG/mug DNA glycosylase family protein n=1 Tax=Helcobacillus massiliensis TaxID=521392 RepID=A0A839QSS5_9MICO|nr:mismatch-specific DNA-glycosylase [Helcobacillus massiliensis]MBB3022805.1 TDG/mug DNA glycosylase family protein [Helcobacillus massiliensis]
MTSPTDLHRTVALRPRRPSPLGGAKPTRADLAAVDTADPNGVDDVLPAGASHRLDLLIVGINPGLWTAAVNAPFARPGNRFWPALNRAGMTDAVVDCSLGLTDEDALALLRRGIGLTNLIGRATARADQLSREELRAAGVRLVHRVQELRPRAVAIAGITAYRTAFRLPKAQLGRQDPSALPEDLPRWPTGTALWVVPQPSGLNAHENIDSLAEKWLEVLADIGRT